jgi:hypothetical protein
MAIGIRIALAETTMCGFMPEALAQREKRAHGDPIPRLSVHHEEDVIPFLVIVN